ncbi:hypothetical protein [Geitlerinema sp. PCC 9228]|jgi:hypothetical protein|uniref:hypothetical protein n=1 Tax=Geitlerinema sp. PCC 9228 TaxID=111611 RepID=UPI0008F9A061|nr:hypothetical protein [Geitlerinema sp. PCC 9228]
MKYLRCPCAGAAVGGHCGVKTDMAGDGRFTIAVYTDRDRNWVWDAIARWAVGKRHTENALVAQSLFNPQNISQNNCHEI